MVASTAPRPSALHRSAFVGRDAERGTLDAALDRARRFQAPQVVTILGPLGAGKSRLVDEWSGAIESGGGVRVVRAAAADPVESGEAEAFSLVAAFLRARLGLSAGETAEAAHVRFKTELQSVFGDRRVAEVGALLGRFLGFESPESPLSQAIATKSEQETDLSRAVLGRFMEEDARRLPLVVVLENLHLADDRSLDVIEQLAAELGEAPMVLVATARPELLVRRPGWGRGEGSHVRIDLAPLGRREIDAVLKSILGAETLAPGLAERAAVESGGNPFLLDQLVRVYLQHGILAAATGDSWTFDVERASRESMALTPEEAAQVRIAALSATERELLARATAFGVAFWTGGLVALGRFTAEPSDPTAVFAPDPAIDEIRRLLEDLAGRDYLTRVASPAIPGEGEWAWRSATERSLLASAVDPHVMRLRKRFAAQWLETRGSAAREDRLELLGGLYEQGGDVRRAAYCLISAADDRAGRLQLARARALYLRGIRLLDLDDSVAKMDALHRVGDLAARLGRTREALAHFGEMLRLAWRLDLPAKGGAAHDRIGRLHRALGDYRRALSHLELAHRLFEIAGDRPGIASTLDDIGRVHRLTGNLDASMGRHRAALALRQEIGDDKGRALTLAWMGEVEHERGDLEAAGRYFGEALELRRASGDRRGVVSCLFGLGGIERDLGRGEKALAILGEARAMARELGERLAECYVLIEMGDTWLSEGRPRDAQPFFKEAGEIAHQFGARRLTAEAVRGTAETQLAMGDALKARDEARMAMDIAKAIGSKSEEGAALRVMGAAVGLGAPGDADVGGAREIFDRAVSVLESAGAELELGRALAAYAEFEERSGRDGAAASLRQQADAIRDRARAAGRGGRRRARGTGLVGAS